MILSCDSFCPFFSKCPKIEEFYFRFLFCFKIDHVHFFRNARFSYHIRLALFLKCPIFPISESNRKNRVQRIRTNNVFLSDSGPLTVYGSLIKAAPLSAAQGLWQMQVFFGQVLPHECENDVNKTGNIISKYIERMRFVNFCAF